MQWFGISGTMNDVKWVYDACYLAFCHWLPNFSAGAWGKLMSLFCSQFPFFLSLSCGNRVWHPHFGKKWFSMTNLPAFRYVCRMWRPCWPENILTTFEKSSFGASGEKSEKGLYLMPSNCITVMTTFRSWRRKAKSVFFSTMKTTSFLFATTLMMMMIFCHYGAQILIFIPKQNGKKNFIFFEFCQIALQGG